mmetsp:Transcript_14199/g.56603  ORF Transcript_14199/g.56603 Transcript_14199/m.56603 type:complete len:232 (-) Transcript_14199:454-1149(-)
MATSEPNMRAVAPQNEYEPQTMPSGDGKAPPPLARLIATMRQNMPISTPTFHCGAVSRSSSRIALSSGLGGATAAGDSSPGPPLVFSAGSAASPAWGVCSSGLNSACVASVASRAAASSARVLSCCVCAAVSLRYNLMPFLSVRSDVSASNTTKRIVMTSSGATLFTNPPTSAPASVCGSMSINKSQSTMGRSACGCRFMAFIATLVIAPPRTVKFDSGIANLGLKPMTST